MDVNEKYYRTFDQVSRGLSNELVLPLLFLLIAGGYASAAPTVQLHLDQPVIVKEGSLEATVKVSNPSDEEVSVSVPAKFERGLRVSNGGQAVETSLSEPDGTENRTIAPHQFIGTTVQVTPKKEWDRPVKLNVSWEHGELSSDDATAYYFPKRKAKIQIKGYAPLYLDLYFQDAPRNVFHFAELIRTESFYDGKEFHRLIKGFLLQGGAQDPGSDQTYEVAPEPNDRKHKFGTVSMAHGRRSKKNGTQFFITLGRQHYLDGQYTVIGRVKEDGHSVLRQIQEQVKTDHDDLGGQCGVDHTDEPKNPLVMESVSLLTPEEYKNQSEEQAGASGGASQDGENNGTSASENPLESGPSSDDQDQ